MYRDVRAGVIMLYNNLEAMELRKTSPEIEMVRRSCSSAGTWGRVRVRVWVGDERDTA